MPDNIQLIDFNIPATLTVSSLGAIEIPENSEIANVTIDLATAPTGSTVAFDVLDQGNSIFGQPLGSVRTGQTAQAGSTSPGVLSTDPTVTITPSAAGVAPVIGQVLTIDTEDVLVTAVGGSYLTTGAGPEYRATITRGYNGTAPATHAAGTNIFPAKPKVMSGVTLSAGKYVASPAALRNIAPIAAGDGLALTCTAIGSGAAGGGGNASLEAIQR